MPLRLDRGDIARSGYPPKDAPRVARSKRCGVQPEGRGLRHGRRAPSAGISELRGGWWQRFTDDRDLVGLKIGILAGMGILTAMLDRAA